MAVEPVNFNEDLDKTDELPILTESMMSELGLEEADEQLQHTTDVPSLAQSVRSVEETFARQRTDLEALTRAVEVAREAELAAVGRAEAAQAQAEGARSQLADEHARVEEAARESGLRERELRAERDASVARFTQVAAELQTLRAQSQRYLEQLQSRQWRLEFDRNLFREMDTEVATAQARHHSLEAEHDGLRLQVASLAAKLAARDEANERQQGAIAESLSTAEQLGAEVVKLTSKQSELIVELSRLQVEGALRAQAHADAIAAASLEVRNLREQLATAEQGRLEELAQNKDLLTAAEAREQEMAVLLAHLHEARRPIQSIEGDIARLTLELAAKCAAFEEVSSKNQQLRATVENTRRALETAAASAPINGAAPMIAATPIAAAAPISPAAPIVAAAPISAIARTPEIHSTSDGTPLTDCFAELIRLDGERPVTYALGRRTRIGRAAGCELQIDSTSVSRHHALLIVGARECIIEDLNSTNGVFVNGRKVARQMLNDGDSLTIGETQFRYCRIPGARRPD